MTTSERLAAVYRRISETRKTIAPEEAKLQALLEEHEAITNEEQLRAAMKAEDAVEKAKRDIEHSERGIIAGLFDCLDQAEELNRKQARWNEVRDRLQEASLEAGHAQSVEDPVIGGWPGASQTNRCGYLSRLLQKMASGTLTRESEGEGE